MCVGTWNRTKQKKSKAGCLILWKGHLLQLAVFLKLSDDGLAELKPLVGCYN